MNIISRLFLFIAAFVVLAGALSIGTTPQSVYAADCNTLNECLNNWKTCTGKQACGNNAVTIDAAQDCYNACNFTVPQPTGVLVSIPSLISGAIQLILIIAGLIAFVMLLLGGMKWISSQGEKGEVEEARNQIIQALIGLIVVLAAWGLVILVQAITGICLGFGCDLTLPTL